MNESVRNWELLKDLDEAITALRAAQSAVADAKRVAKVKLKVAYDNGFPNAVLADMCDLSPQGVRDWAKG